MATTKPTQVVTGEVRISYTAEGAGVKELYKVASVGIDYEVRSIERWNRYIKLIVKELVSYE